ncbi:hypothetical protein LXL04_031675 [Taraxacum kok-saghyz]
MLPAVNDGKESQTSTSMESSLQCRHFELHEILLATNNFDESLVIGCGGFGKVYQGHIVSGPSRIVAAIKRLDSMSAQGASEFWAEVEMLSKLRHCHLVSLLGYCNHEKEMILIYEYMPNGTLEDHLHKLRTPLSWLRRLKICIGAARGLDYLHTGTGIESGVIHRDVKTSNILLHGSWAAKISDFGLSKIGPTNQPSTYVNTLVKGTFGYFDPNYFITGRLTRKSDVYAFGVVLLEVLCRKRAVDSSLGEEQPGLVTWVQDSIREGKLKNIIDSDIRVQISAKCLKEYVRIAERCLHSSPKLRPTMAEVVVSLDSILIRSLQPTGSTIFGRMVDKFAFTSNKDNSAHVDSSTSKDNNRYAGGDDSAGVDKDFALTTLTLRVFKLADLKRATRNFSQDLRISSDNFAEDYLGWVDKDTFCPSAEGRGIAVTVKKCLPTLGPREKLQAMVTLSGQLAHENIITLLGYCDEYRDKYIMLLVYEYFLQNQNLSHFLFGDGQDVAEPLSWETRLRIMIGVARGIAYLHSLENQVIHRDIKTSNILLDQDFGAKLGGFESARFGPEMGETHVSTWILGSFGYLDPVYVKTGHLSAKSDIYSFGVVLLETLTGRRAIMQWSQPQCILLVKWASSFLTSRSKLKEVMDPRLEQNYPLDGAFEYAALVSRCVADHPKDRPSSEEVLRSLEQIYMLLPNNG